MDTILITGGTGSFGQAAVKKLYNARNTKLVVFSRDELKQSEMRKIYPEVKYIIGDIRDPYSIASACEGVDYVIHAAAMKQVPACEDYPLEAITTNILGAKNLIGACKIAGVKKLIALSTDKAVNPINLYGATKLCMEKLMIAANSDTCRISCTRYGNVIGSRGSVIPLFKQQRDNGSALTITHPDMSRFWISLNDAVVFVLDRLDDMFGGEIFVPKMQAMRIVDLAEAIAPDCNLQMLGVRKGEKLHEVLISKDDFHTCHDMGLYYRLYPDTDGSFLAKSYSSDTAETMSIEDLRGLV